MKNKKVGLIILFSFALALAGCNKGEDTQSEAAIEAKERKESGFGITKEEQKICAEYAAGVLMKYNTGSNMRVLEGENLKAEEEEERIQREKEEKRQQLAAEYEASKEQESQPSDTSSKSGDGTTQEASVERSYIDDVSTAVGTDAFSIKYDGYEVTQSYSGMEDNGFFAVDAVPGKTLLVTRFSVTNISPQTESLLMYSVDGKYVLNLDGESYKAHRTLLLDDLSMYKGELNSGETKQAVLVFEVPQEKASNISNMELCITVGEEEQMMLLQGENQASVMQEALEESEEEIDPVLEEGNTEEEGTGENVTVVGSNNSTVQE